MLKPVILALAVLMPSPSVTDGDGGPSLWCEVAEPIYIHVRDYRHLLSTSHGRKAIAAIEAHNQAIIDFCGDLPRTRTDK